MMHLMTIPPQKILYREGKYSKTCFFSQQAAGKALKGLCIYKLRVYKHTHSVAELLRYLSAQEELIQKGEYLDRFYVPTRYPNVWPSGAPYKHYKKEDAEIALKYAEEVLNYVKEQVK